jgi:arabinofuranosyltransferase
MLLHGTFMLLCPVSAIPLPPLAKARSFAVTTTATTGVLAWSVLCATFWRLPQLPDYIPPTGITNERAFWTERVGVANPVDATPYVQAILGAPDDPTTVAWLLDNSNPNSTVLLLPGASTKTQLPLNEPGRPVAIAGDILGTLGAQAPLNGLVIDIHGLSYAFGSHIQPAAGGRVGHNKIAGNAWIVAEYSSATAAPNATAVQIAAARQALACGDLHALIQATTAPMSWSRFWSNVADSYKLTELRVAPNPAQAEAALCGHPR